ncbi:hypothetical protein [Lysinibacillus sp. Y5S-8]|uniref:hypothetical protein n=1 Tax=Lysinibacillus sp. Y5S-8 TaxID=3122488 RepID=UPI0030CEBE7A
MQNRRFTFDSKYNDYWFKCRATNDKGKCTNIFVQIYFKDHSLTQANSHLEEEFNTIFMLFEKRYSFIEESSDNSIHFTGAEIAQYASTADFIKKISNNSLQ